MIWLALLIPVIAIGITAFFYSQKMHIAEYLILFIVPTICIVVGKYCSVHSQTHDEEFWNSYATYAIYEEEWKERWEEMHTEVITDSEGNTTTRTYWTTEYANHPEQWTLYDNIGEHHRIPKSFFERICVTWNMRQFKEMDRRRTSRHRHESSFKIIKDGDAYETKIPSKDMQYIIPLCKQHNYENRVQCSKSVFNFQEVSPEDKEKYQLFEYPEENLFGFSPILGASNGSAILKLQKYNALNGSRSQLHMMVLVFTDQPIEAGFFQEAYWKGGNKNEFIVCIGTDGADIKWTKVISWTEQEELKAKVAREIMEQKKLDLVKIIDYIGETVPKGFIRKEFEDFSYIAVRPSTTAVVITYVITLLVTGIIFVIVVKNSYDFESGVNKNCHW
jgi:hypothetical protein